jgi:hypothetical protein
MGELFVFLPIDYVCCLFLIFFFLKDCQHWVWIGLLYLERSKNVLKGLYF